MREITISADAPTFLPVDLAILKQDLRITHSELDYALEQQYVPDALSWAEGTCRRAICSRPHRWVLDEFPCGSDLTLLLPRGKVSAVASIVYSKAGVPTTLRGPTSGSPAGTDWQEDLLGHQGRLLPPRGQTWPTADYDAVSPVIVTFTAGWAQAAIPADLKRAITFSVGQALELRGLLPEDAGLDLELREQLISGFRCV